jgi:hypothetical protein
MIYTDQQIDVLLEKANEIGFNTALGIVRSFDEDVQEKYKDALRQAMREILELLPDAEPQAEESVVYGVLCQPWWESERGWGQRPDGFTLHASFEDHKRFTEDHWKKQKAYFAERGLPEGHVPDAYTFASGDPFVVEVDEETYRAVTDPAVAGIWGQGNKAPEKANRRDLELGPN